MIPVGWVINHTFKKVINSAKPLNDFHAIMRIDGKTHCKTRGEIGVVGLGGTV
jgi:hypothetical protein